MTLVLQAQGLSFRYSGQPEPLFIDVTAHLHAGDKVALLGHNGAGKTTLLRVLLGELAATEGDFSCLGQTALLKQEDRLETGGTVLETLLASSPEHGALYRKMKALESLTEPLAYADAVNDFAEAGGYDLLQTLEAEADALGFAPEVLARPVAGLSGGERLALRGENGSGKSTLIRLLLAQLKPDRGELLWSKGVTLGYLPQLWSAPPVGRAAELFGDDEAQAARTLLGALNVKGDAFYSPLESLSEGQKRKVSLARLMLDKPNVLILDEPTTHLDYESVEMLESALSNFTGTLLLVSHDKYLRERVTDRELVL